jgi:ASC-1-like (ASCH) protein
MNDIYTFKCQAPYWGYVASRRKTFEVRIQDPQRPVKEGDHIRLAETYDGKETGKYLTARVIYILKIGEVSRLLKSPCKWQDCDLEIWSLDSVGVGV